MHTLNLGILAHVDAGKTSLTERLLHAAGVVEEVGSVDDGSTRTDSLALERRRGITIKSAVVSFALDGITVNLIDTPGHPDFIAEVERVLHVLDGAVLVVSAVEGVQAQTRVLMRTLRRLALPTLVFVNKTDRRGARDDALVRDIAAKLTPGAVAMGAVRELGTRDAAFTPYGPGHPDHAAFTARLADVLTGHDDALLADYVADEAAVTYRRLRKSLAEQTAGALVHPVYFGSAATGAGVAELTAGIKELLPAPAGDAEGPPAGTVFKVERGPGGEKVAYVRMLAGTLRTRQELAYGDGDRAPVTEKVTGVEVFEQGEAVPAAGVGAGRIGLVRGLAGVRIGDAVGAAVGRAADARRHHFAPPTLETVVVPDRAADRGALHAALFQLAEQDPLIALRQDDIRRELYVSLYGEVQKEVIGATLAEEYGLPVSFRESSVIHVERLAGGGSAYEKGDTDTNPFLATVGLRVEPAPPGTGVVFALAVELGSMPYAFFKAVEDTVRATLRQGLAGWEIPDVRVTMTHSGYWPRQSHAHQGFSKAMSSTGADFRGITPLVVADALKRAGTRVHEPVQRFRLEAPGDAVPALWPVFAALDAVVDGQEVRGGTAVLEGEVPAARVHALERRLPGLTRGEGVLETAFGRYRAVRGPAPARPRTDHNPLDRKEYLLHVQRRV
ncbi:TetM/TetW/TetO/TetS family tetracycline resistance ribosomal protection protein [Streptomyces sp. WMMC500]|uniref:elongation factor G n=1 Tax=Streptomyces sp. WMMC500 TaxID=3015154 RepID=UPI00248CCFFA|nr:TetM/TetW/TetO/TetS family tetracycline resistance ribosomal protection protein [Streptomyces sp. WMMC500]WBB61426.1 TetM/TetW/TetO/TetS family tetracycline resistance ribosomal protection protein [Streptomyces sp. WMMC500]